MAGGLTFSLGHPSQFCQVQRMAGGLTLTCTPLSASISGITYKGSRNAKLDGHRMEPQITPQFDTETDQSQCDLEYRTKLAMTISKALGSYPIKF